MPSTRSMQSGLWDGELPEDEFDPDYVEESDEDDLPQSIGRDRAQWVVDNTDALEDLYRAVKEYGQRVFGGAFLQTGNITAFSHFVYKYTSPGAD